jgi:hypothetical protein
VKRPSKRKLSKLAKAQDYHQPQPLFWKGKKQPHWPNLWRPRHGKPLMKQKLKQTKSITDSINALCPLSSPQNHCTRIQLLSTNYNPPQNNNNTIQNENEIKAKISIKIAMR